MRVCIVTPDIVGPIKNGGIGTHCFNLASLLARNHIDTTVLFTGPLIEGSESKWQNYYAELGIVFSLLNSKSTLYPSAHIPWPVLRSLRVHEYLRTRAFDVVHFQNWQGNGFIPIQAKKMGLAYQETILTETLHSPTAWIHQGMRQFAPEAIEYFALDYCEGYSFSNADYGLSPSQYMLNWATQNNWRLPPDRRVMRLPFLPQEDWGHSEPYPADRSHLIFFGRVETRKGFEVFIEAVHLVLTNSPSAVSKLSILGKKGHLTGSIQDPKALLKSFAKQHPNLEIVWHQDFDYREAIQYIKRTQGVVVMPSLQDNSPFTIIEAITHGIPFVASRVGGVPELVSSESVLFDPNPAALAERIERVETSYRNGVTYAYSNAEANTSWLAFHEEISHPPRMVAKATSRDILSGPRVSVCIPHFNMSSYLAQLLASLTQSSYHDFEVICLDDGSSNPSDLDGFLELKNRYSSLGWRFEVSDNRGIGSARNTAASFATGDFLLFMDADNLALPHMIRRMAGAMAKSGMDCLTCHFYGFETLKNISESSPTLRYCPIGPCLAIGCVFNMLGDANLIIKKSVFDELGGFTVDRETSWEDWEFLAKLVLSGYSLDVIPEALFWYRVTPEGFSRTTRKYANYQRLLRPWREHFPPHIDQIINHLLILYNNQLNIDGRSSSLRFLMAQLSGPIEAYLAASRLKGFAPVIRGLYRLVDGIMSRLAS